MFGLPDTSDDADDDLQLEKRQTLSIFGVRYRGDCKVAPKMIAIDHKFASLSSDASDSAGSLIDVIAFVIHCKTHDRLATYSIKSSVDEVRWLPFSPLLAHKSWEESAVFGAALILSESSEPVYNDLKKRDLFELIQFVEQLRIQTPHNTRFLNRLIYYVRLSPEASSGSANESSRFQCCRNTAQINWVEVQQLADNQIEGTIWGPELVQYSRVVLENFCHFSERIDEISLDEVYYYVPRDPPRNVEEKLLLQLEVKEKLIEILYSDFLEHSYPAITLPFGSFKHYMYKFGFDYNDPSLSCLFAAFNYLRNGYVSFNELLMGLACIDPQASHGETRLKFIFRFYDNGKGYIDQDSFRSMIEDMHPCLEGKDITNKINEGFKVIRSETRSDGNLAFTFSSFAKAVAGLKFRGTSSLCRSTTLVFGQLARAYAHKRVPNLGEGMKEWHDLKTILTPRCYPSGDGSAQCAACKKEGKFNLASHAIEMNSFGYIGRPVKLLELRSRLIDAHSSEYIFKADSLPNRIIRLVRQFSQNKGTVSQPRGLLETPDQKSLVSILSSLAVTLKPIFEKESRCPDVPQPAIIVGDIHGNLEDLLTLERNLWRSFPCCAGNYVFLGDYVDRGRWGMECALYLMAMKCLAPKRVILLRGNHEIRSVQEKYTFKKECLHKYGDSGVDIWEMINAIFDVMPICGTVDRAVFCVHGGLSPKAATLEEVNSMPKCIPSPEDDSKAGWEMMWSDPCHMQKYLDIIEMSNEMNPFAHEGYLHNCKRGAGYLFNERAVGCFLMKNNLSFLVRAHEVPTFGFAHHFRNLCTTIFSCSHYCNSDNEASVILIDDNRLRVIRIDTRNNASATDP